MSWRPRSPSTGRAPRPDRSTPCGWPGSSEEGCAGSRMDAVGARSPACFSAGRFGILAWWWGLTSPSPCRAGGFASAALPPPLSSGIWRRPKARHGWPTALHPSGVGAGEHDPTLGDVAIFARPIFPALPPPGSGPSRDFRLGGRERWAQLPSAACPSWPPCAVPDSQSGPSIRRAGPWWSRSIPACSRVRFESRPAPPARSICPRARSIRARPFEPGPAPARTPSTPPSPPSSCRDTHASS